MKYAICLKFTLLALAYSSGSLAQNPAGNNDFDVASKLRSRIFIRSNDEIHFVPNRGDEKLKKPQEFRFDMASQSLVFEQLKNEVGDRQIDICPDPNVDLRLLAAVMRLFSDPKHELQFCDLYSTNQRANHVDVFEPNTVREDNARKMMVLRTAFEGQILQNQWLWSADKASIEIDSQPSEEGLVQLKRTLRTKFAAMFDQRQELQLNRIDAQITKLEILKGRIKERATRKDEEVKAMLETFLRESIE